MSIAISGLTKRKRGRKVDANQSLNDLVPNQNHAAGCRCRASFTTCLAKSAAGIAPSTSRYVSGRNTAHFQRKTSLVENAARRVRMVDSMDLYSESSGKGRSLDARTSLFTEPVQSLKPMSKLIYSGGH